MVERRFHSTSPEATEALGEALGRGLASGDVVALTGELGAGKTCLVRGVARALGVEARVTSPTFTLMQEHEGRLPLHHFDAWMAGRETHFLDTGGADYLGGEGVALVEWAERIEAWLPTPRLRVDLAHAGSELRLVALSVVGEGSADPRAARLVELLADLVAPAGLVEIPAARDEPLPTGDVDALRDDASRRDAPGRSAP